MIAKAGKLSGQFHNEHSLLYMVLPGIKPQNFTYYITKYKGVCIQDHDFTTYMVNAHCIWSFLQLKIDRLHSKWSSSLMIGVTSLPLNKLTELPKSALNLTRSTWLFKSTCVFHNGRKVSLYFWPKHTFCKYCQVCW